MQGHTLSVWSLAIHTPSGRLFSSGSDGKIKGIISYVHQYSYFVSSVVWDLSSGVCCKSLTNHTGKVYRLVVNGDKLYSASSDKSIKVFCSSVFLN